MIVHLVPSMDPLDIAMYSNLVRYNWHQFAILRLRTTGRDCFVYDVCDRVPKRETNFKFIIVTTVTFLSENDVLPGLEAERLFLQIADKLGLTGANYVWIVTQTDIGESLDTTPVEFPVDMLGKLGRK
jgi:hypothetical protein